MQVFKILSDIQSSSKKKKNNNKKIGDICLNSKHVKKNDIFVALKGKKYDVRKFFSEAINNGSSGIITNVKKIVNNKIPIIYNKEIKNKLPSLLKYYYQKLPNRIIAVTGTNGKTSVSWYLYQILLLNEIKVSYLGTIGQYINKKKISNLENTTPDICTLFRLASKHYEKGIDSLIFEASSHGIYQDRIKGFPITIAAITNITKDHIDYHKNFQSYKEAKLKLFTKYLNNKGIAIVNSSINFPIFFKEKLISKSVSIITYGNARSDVYIRKNINKFILKIKKKKYKLSLNFFHDYDLKNFECTIAIAMALGIKIESIIKGINLIKRPPGRMELCNSLYNNSKVYIDYAHTPDALSNILKSIIKSNRKKSNLVFGCGGDRDKSKRVIMGKIAFEFANKVYITDDNPRNEDANNIRTSIFKGCPKASLISSRKKAIERAIQELNNEEVLIISGKGHEKNQIIKNNIINFDDLLIANNFIKKLNNKYAKLQKY